MAKEPNDSLIKNLILYQKENEPIKVKMMSYDLTHEEIESIRVGQYVDLTDKTYSRVFASTAVDGFMWYDDAGCLVSATIVTVPGSLCSEGLHAYDDGRCNLSGNEAATPPQLVIRYVFAFCDMADNGGGSSGSGSSNGGSTGGGNELGGGSGSGGSYNPGENPFPDEEMITTPVIPELEGEIQNTPCQELNDIDIDTNFSSKITELKAKAGSQNFESGYVIYKNPSSGLSFSNEFTGSSTYPEVAMNIESDVTNTQSTLNSLGFIHCHLDNTTTFKIFSFSDILVLAEVARLTARPQNEIAGYLVTSSGTFAMKVKNKTLLKNQKGLMEISKNQMEKEFKRFVNVNQSLENQKLGFLKFIEHMPLIGNPGIDLYQKDESTGKWNKLLLSNDENSINETPCN